MAKLNEKLADDLWDLLENFYAIKVELNEGTLAATFKELKSNVDEGVYGEDSDGELTRYLEVAYDTIIEWNFSYDEALNIVAGEFGYNQQTGKIEEYTAGVKVNNPL